MKVKFTGKFKDLIPNGWTFQKLFARNYRQYSKTSNGEKYGPSFSIWQHLGGYIEFEDYFSNTSVIFDWVLSGDYKKNQDSLGEHKWYTTVLNKDERKLENFNFTERLWENYQNNISTEDLKDFYKKYKEVVINDNEVNFILDLKEKGWINNELTRK